MPRYLGLDASTQSLTAFVIDTDAGELALDLTVSFGKDLPEFDCPNGFLEHADPLVKHSDPKLWLAALDRLLARGREQGFDWGSIAGISGSGQQHGSVYLNKRFAGLRLAPEQGLAEQFAPCFSRATAPIWMDSATSAECAEIASAVGGNDVVTGWSGSQAIERFTGPQIRKFAKDAPEQYAATARIHLVSSFMASVLCGGDAAIDPGDGAGMNLMDLATRTWRPELLAATADGLAARLPDLVAADTQVGAIADYFVEKYGFAAGTPVIAFSGDNPNSLVGMGATEPGTVVVSLGTSDTCFAAMAAPRTDPRGYGHVFGNPAGGFMCLICFTNGSLAREAVAEELGLDWDAFSQAILQDSRPGNDGNLMLPYFTSETTPKLSNPQPRYFGNDDFVNGTAKAARARAIVEAQALSMKLHSDWIGETPARLLVTGGASQNPGIRQVLADVFQAELQSLTVTNSAALGAALRAANAVGQHDWADLFATFSRPDRQVTRPDRALAGLYADLAQTYATKLSETYHCP